MKPSRARTYENLIAGRWVASSSGETFDSVNPADSSDVVGYFQQSTVEEARQAIEAARDAYPSWSETAPSRRAEVLHRAAQRF